MSSRSESGLSKVNILGVGVSALSMSRAVEIVARWLEDGGQHYVCVTSVHGVIESQRSEELRTIHNNADLVTPDGMPLVWLMKLKGHRGVQRVYGPDLMWSVLSMSSERGFKQFFYGASEESLTDLRKNLTRSFPALNIAGSFSPPFRPLSEQEDRQVVEMLNRSEADIVWVGLSTPKQERWMAEHRRQLRAPVIIGVGAAFDFHAGVKPQAPRVMRHSGLEWLFRLVTEPRRLWRRYLLIVPSFLILIACQCAGLKRYPIDVDR